MTMTDDRQERIRNRAHQIWQEEGHPAGQHERHWHQAAADVDREDAGKPTVGKKPAKKAPGASKAKAAPKQEKLVAKASKPKASKPKKAAK
ncbi:DUF2934 domain-containing protein [Mesorhizobium sp. ESP6-5]|uniref:DUF2934 domain-containing protein n=1 Tax=unclassified Mesorhizobium TaxID=325217 RepID=UPI001128CF8A|nr:MULTISPECIES: DUF2934 domain-containing protein [unclassified Mesorhizobium]MBZ9679938.1 DUF2934 domain-containing protein [Mesorhizobium sp. CO1-1-2]MBZ9724633.1 DUF2934 domain-containing protein [Mesorhizobium sp. CO1-1-11]MBZ9755535.1 DUF2934 domain-containing protein [Mesorhizobium sp. ESP6-5]MBZ9924709.1 DUF2934 domain-containing protein [Mesorhizobium sp. BR1-1-4]TPK74973.1 DUF2934 domain-containing protein [Mesorhizobium sp. B2-4-18]